MVLFSYNRIYRDQTLSARITRGMFVASYNKIYYYYYYYLNSLYTVTYQPI